MLDQLAATFPFIKLKYPKKDGPTERPITDAEIVQVAIEDLHKKRVIEKDV